MLSITISKFFYVKDPFKKDDEQQKKIAKPWPFNCEKSIDIVICGKCLVQSSSFIFMSSSCYPFQK